MVIRKCIFFNFAKTNTLFFVGYPAIMTLKAMKRETLLPSLHCICLVSRSVYPIMILNSVSATWQDNWNGAVASKLHSMKSFLGDWQSSYMLCRKDEVVLCRAHIGHTHLTHSYILRKDPRTQCEH